MDVTEHGPGAGRRSRAWRLRIGWHTVPLDRRALGDGVPAPDGPSIARIRRRPAAAAALSAAAVVIAAAGVMVTVWSASPAGPASGGPGAAGRAEWSPGASTPDAPATVPRPDSSPTATSGPVPVGSSPTAVKTTSRPPATTPASTPTPRPAPAPTAICLSPDCPVQATFRADGEHLVVCDLKADGYAGLALYVVPGGAGQQKVWASGGAGTCTDKDLSLAEGSTITYKVCIGDQSESRIDRCGPEVVNIA